MEDKFPIIIETRFRSFPLSVYVYDASSEARCSWGGPKGWWYEIEHGVELWGKLGMPIDVVEFLDKLNIGRSTPRGG